MTKTILFDLDGTLTDPKIGITNSVKYALSKFGIEVKDRTILYPFIGPPLVDSFMEYYHFSLEEAEKALQYYREYFSKGGMFENEVYEGIEDMLSSLNDRGIDLYGATSKPEEYSVKILEHFGLGKYFKKIVGATMDEKRNKKEDIIEYALRENKIDTQFAVMVGDRKFDILGGKKFGLKTVGVTFGYGGEDELSDAKADYIATSVLELRKLLLEI